MNKNAKTLEAVSIIGYMYQLRLNNNNSVFTWNNEYIERIQLRKHIKSMCS